MAQRKRYKIQITQYDEYTLYPNEKTVYRAILEETILKNKRCAILSLNDLSQLTDLNRATVDNQLKNLVKRRLIEIDKPDKTNRICIITTYKERLGRGR